MGYRGKLAEIATRLGVSKSSVSLWVRDVEFTPLPRPPGGRRREPNALQRRKQAEVERLAEEGRARIGRLSEREFLVAGVALYAGRGASGTGR
jgi:transposase